jgi:hypothetical protein
VTGWSREELAGSKQGLVQLLNPEEGGTIYPNKNVHICAVLVFLVCHKERKYFLFLQHHLSTSRRWKVTPEQVTGWSREELAGSKQGLVQLLNPDVGGR